MELKKYELDENCKKYDMSENGKHLTFSNNFLDHLSIELYYDGGRYLCFSEHFDVKKEDSAYDLLDSIFFSYGGNVIFDTDGAGLSLEKKENGDYSFVFDRTFCEENNVIVSTVNSYSIEDESLKMFFNELEQLTVSDKKDETPKKKILKNKKILKD